MFEATLKNRSSAHFAPVTSTFPIPEDQYEQAILALEKSQIGDARVQDCLIDNVHAPNCPALVRMTGTMANVDELDWLGKQLESFDRYELLQFNAAVERFGLSAADELIDLSFCARDVTVVSDFNDLELVGKRHYLTVHGACDSEALENLDGKETALALISGQPGYVTRYGVVYPCVLTASFSAGAGASAGTIGYAEEVTPTLKGSPSGNCMPSVMYLHDQGGQRMDVCENMTGTLRASEKGHQPLVYENHGVDARIRESSEISPTVTARFGTGGGNTPLVQEPNEVYCIVGNIIDRQPENGGNGCGYQENLAYTITTVDRHAVYARQRVDEFKNDNIASMQSARQAKDATDLVVESNRQYAQLIRRLTPLECERLQGFPDDWTNIPGASDSARYRALGNSVAIPCVEFIMRSLKEVASLGM